MSGTSFSLRQAALVGAAVAAIAGPAHAQSTRDFDIPAQPLISALESFGRQSGAEILFDRREAAGRTSAAVKGTMAPSAALVRVLAGTGLSMHQANASTFIVGGRASDPVGGATPPPATDVSELIVTGTHISGAGPQSSPTRVIGQAEIRASGRTTLRELLQLLPQNSGGGVSPEGFNVTGVGADVTQQGSGVNLRGLGQRATLVLLNGNRLAPSGDGSFVDISLIPLSAVERVEVLTDGASAIYGSDAVGGVVNIILKRDYDGAETSVLGGGSTRGDQGLFEATQMVGRRWSGGRALFGLEYRKQDPGYSQDHDTSIGLHPGVALIPGMTTRMVTADVGQAVGPNLSLDLTGLYAKSDTVRDYYQSGSSLVSARGDSDLAALGGGLSYAVGPHWRLKADFDYSRNAAHTDETLSSDASLINNYVSHNSLLEGGLGADGDLFPLPAGPVKIALGAQLRRDAYDVHFAAAATSPIASDQDRRITSLFAETEIPLFSPQNAEPGLRRLTLNAAVRYERYSDFGSTSDPKFGVVWEPVKGLRLRASYDTSFRAPLLSETGGGYYAVLFDASGLAVPGATASGVALVLSSANPALKPERSRTYTVGFDYEPPWLVGAQVTVDYFDTRYSNRIATPSQTAAVIGDPALAQIINAHPTAAQVQALLDGAALRIDVSGPGYTNGHATPESTTFIIDDRTSNNAITTTSGLDVEVRYHRAVGQTLYSGSLAAAYLFDFDNRIVATAPAASLVDTVYEPTHLKVRASLEADRGAWSGAVSASYVNGYDDVRFAPVRYVGAFTTVDLSIAYVVPVSAPGWLQGIGVRASVLNLFDRDPPFVSLASGAVTGVTYDPTNASGSGRTASLRITKTW